MTEKACTKDRMNREERKLKRKQAGGCRGWDAGEKVFPQTTVEFGNLHSRAEGRGPAWVSDRGKPIEETESREREMRGLVSEKSERLCRWEKEKRRRKDNRHRKGAWM